MSLSIRWRLTLWITGALLAALVVIFLVLSFALRTTLTSDLDDDLTADIDQVVTLVFIRGVENEAALQDVVDRFSVGGLSSGFVVLLRDADGNVVAASQSIDPEEFALSDGEIERVLDGEAVSRNLDIRGDEQVRVRAVSVTVGGEVLGIVEVAESTDAISATLDRLRTLFLAVGGVAVVVAFAVAYWLSRWSLRPIEEVAAVAAQIEASDLTRRLEARGQPSEVQRLSDTFDAMLERLDRAFQQQRNFVLDVAHELRTPLTALRGNIDVLLMTEGLDPEKRAQLERMSGETSRLIRLTTNLLYLALAEAGHELDRRPVELDVVCLEVYHIMRDLQPEVKLRLGNEDQVSVTGDRDLLKQLILNIVENGIKYTPAGGQVTLSLFRDEVSARVVVEDTGRGIPADQIPFIFERFHRVTVAGSRGSGGAGIGLAIADWIARAHGGEIVVQSEVGKGSAFTIVLPAEPLGASVHPAAEPGAPEAENVSSPQ
ncbi:MAG: ATP-binding protein [Dehalococcoidia bacterium]